MARRQSPDSPAGGYRPDKSPEDLSDQDDPFDIELEDSPGAGPAPPDDFITMAACTNQCTDGPSCGGCDYGKATYRGCGTQSATSCLGTCGSAGCGCSFNTCPHTTCGPFLDPSEGDICDYVPGADVELGDADVAERAEQILAELTRIAKLYRRG